MRYKHNPEPRPFGGQPKYNPDRILESAAKAKALTKIGQRVMVRKDDGKVIETTVTQLPWQMGHGSWVVGLEGFSGGYCATRVSPIGEVLPV